MAPPLRHYDQPYRGLPREIRDQIYEYLFTSDGMIDIQLRQSKENLAVEYFSHAYGGDAGRQVCFAIFLASREMSAEALRVLYSKSTFAFNMHANEVRLFLLSIPEDHRKTIKLVTLNPAVLDPERRLKYLSSPWRTAEEFQNIFSSMLRLLTRHMTLDILTVVPRPFNAPKFSHSTRRYNILRAINLELLRTAIHAGDLGSLNWDYTHEWEIKEQDLQLARSSKGARYFRFSFMLPHCVALSLNGLIEHKHPYAEDAGLMIEWEDQDPNSDSRILVVRKRKANEERMNSKAYRALGIEWIKNYMAEMEG